MRTSRPHRRRGDGRGGRPQMRPSPSGTAPRRGRRRREVEAELGRDPRQRDEEDEGRDDEPQAVAARRRGAKTRRHARAADGQRRARATTPSAGIAFTGRASSRPGRRPNGTTAQSAIAGPATSHARRGSAATARSASAIATSAIGKLRSTSARPSPPASPSSRDVVELVASSRLYVTSDDERHGAPESPGAQRLALARTCAFTRARRASASAT